MVHGKPVADGKDDPAPSPNWSQRVMSQDASGVVKEGVVKWFDTKKGFGFISQPDGGPDVFVHFSEITMDGFKDLEEGDKVRYELVTSDKGPKAKSVTRPS